MAQREKNINNMKKNNSKITPPGYNSYLIATTKIKDGEYRKINLLVRKSWWQRNRVNVAIAFVIAIVIYKIYIGDFRF